MAAYTYDQLIELLEKKGYTLDTAPDFTDFPDCSERTLVTISPETAKALIDNDNYLFAGTENEASIEEISLLPNYKVWMGRQILEDIVATDTAADVYVTMQSADTFRTGSDRDEVCLIIKEAVSSLISDHGYSLPDISEDVWLSELPKKLASLDISILSESDTASTSASIPTIIGIVSRERTDEYPDSIFILRGYNEQDCSGPYPCNLVPSINEKRQLAIMPGEYPDFFTGTTNTTGLIQAVDANLGAVTVSDNNITEIATTDITYMCARIPAIKIDDDGYSTVGVSMSTENSEAFLNDIDIGGLVKNVKYIVLDSNDFDAE